MPSNDTMILGRVHRYYNHPNPEYQVATLWFKEEYTNNIMYTHVYKVATLWFSGVYTDTTMIPGGESLWI